MTGRAIVAVGGGAVEVRAIEVPPVGEWDIRVTLERSAVSVGTESYAIGHIASATNVFIPGYAPLARVEAVGDRAAALFAVGERVSYFGPAQPVGGPWNGCGGHQSPAVLSVNLQTRDLMGPDQYCIKVPDGLSSELAAFGGIAAVSSMGATMPETKPGDRVLVVGQGVIGQFAAQHFRLRGAEVAVTDLHKKRMAIAAACGADHLIEGGPNMVTALRALWPDGADIVADTTGSYRVVEASLGAVRRRGSYVFLGWCKGSDFALERLHGQTVFRAYFPWTLEPRHVQHSWRMMKQGGLRVEPLITHRFHVREAPAAYEMIFSKPEDYVGIVFDWE